MMTRSRNELMEHVINLVRSGSKVMFFLSMFLLLTEVVTLFGATSSASRIVDEIAMLVTFTLLFLSVTGTRVLVCVWNRMGKPSEE
jgi:hypothetical protein